jgi:hypothetical protein
LGKNSRLILFGSNSRLSICLAKAWKERSKGLVITVGRALNVFADEHIFWDFSNTHLTNALIETLRLPANIVFTQRPYTDADLSSSMTISVNPIAQTCEILRLHANRNSKILVISSVLAARNSSTQAFGYHAAKAAAERAVIYYADYCHACPIDIRAIRIDTFKKSQLDLRSEFSEYIIDCFESRKNSLTKLIYNWPEQSSLNEI